MYLDYWQLAAKPFEPTPAGAGAFFACESQDGALSKLRYAVANGRPLAALAGPSGVGKTLLVRRLAEATTPSRLVHLVFPQMSGRDLMAYLAERLDAPTSPQPTGSIEESVRRIEQLAEKQHGDQRPLVVIDEAHLLEDSGALETLRLLSNFDSAGGAAFSLLLVGQMRLLSCVARHPTLDERLAVKTLVRGFTAAETAEYVRWRLSNAGAERELFDTAALARLYTHTGGVARQIDRLCDLALVVGMSDTKPIVGERQIDAVQRELLTVGAD